MYQLPNTLRLKRVAANLQQQDVSARSGIEQTYLCALEKGRRIGPNEPLVVRIAKALGLSDIESSELIACARNDRFLKGLTRSYAADEAAFIATALRAIEELTPIELGSLHREIHNLVESKRRLKKLIAQNQPTSKQTEGAPIMA